MSRPFFTWFLRGTHSLKQKAKERHPTKIYECKSLMKVALKERRGFEGVEFLAMRGFYWITLKRTWQINTICISIVKLLILTLANIKIISTHLTTILFRLAQLHGIVGIKVEVAASTYKSINLTLQKRENNWICVKIYISIWPNLKDSSSGYCENPNGWIQRLIEQVFFPQFM